MSLEKFDECRLGKDLEGDHRRLFLVTFFSVQLEEPKKKPRYAKVTCILRVCLYVISSRICLCRN